MESDCRQVMKTNLGFYKMIFLVLLTLLSPSDSSSQVMTHSPSDVTTTMGNRLVLKCTVHNRQGSCQWTKNGFGLGTEPDLPGYSRYSLDNSGDHCDLVLDPVLPEDEAQYQCQVGPGPDGQQGVSSPVVSVTVQHEPGLPHILQTKYGDILEVVLGEQISLECETQGGRPVADIAWRHADGSRVESEVMDIVTRMEDQRTFRTRSVLKMIPEADEDIYCEASSLAFPIPRKSQPVKIRIKDKMSAKLIFSKEQVNVGDSVGVYCAVSNAGNSILSYTWFLNDVEMKAEKLDTIKLENVATQHNNLLIKCRVESSSDTVIAEMPLEVSQPIIVENSEDRILAALGEMVTLHCHVSGGSEDDISYVWTRESDKKLIGVGKDLKIKMTKELEGDVTCTVISGQETATTRVQVEIKQPPTVTIQGKGVQYEAVGETAVLSCEVGNYYDESTKVTWRVGERKIAPDGVKYKVVQHANPNTHTFKSDLVIMNVKEDDFAKYTCEARNDQGHDDDVIDLQSEGKGYWTTIMGFIIVAFFMAGAVFGIYYWTNARKNNVEFMEEEKQRYLKNQNIFKSSDTSPIDWLLSGIKNQNFSIDPEFNYDDDFNESSHLNLNRPKRINRYYSAPSGNFYNCPDDSFQSNDTKISFINEEDD